MTSLAAEPSFRFAAPDRWQVIRAVVFWGFILTVIVSPAVLGAVILLDG